MTTATPSQWARYEYAQALRDIRDAIREKFGIRAPRGELADLREDYRRRLVAEVRRCVS